MSSKFRNLVVLFSTQNGNSNTIRNFISFFFSLNKRILRRNDFCYYKEFGNHSESHKKS